MAETTTSRLQRWIEAMDRPLLGLAILSMCLYLLDLHGLMGSCRAAYLSVNLLIDSIFVVDLLLKLPAQGMAYVRTPWFLIDFLSCLPLLDVLANSHPRGPRGPIRPGIADPPDPPRPARHAGPEDDPGVRRVLRRGPGRREQPEVPPRDELRDDRADRDGPGHHRGGPEADDARVPAADRRRDPRYP